MSLEASKIAKSFRRKGVWITVISVTSAISLGVIDQFTSHIVPSIADYIEDLIHPPQFLVSFVPPIDISGGLSVSSIETGKVGDITVREAVIGTHVFMASAGPGTYLVQVRGVGEKAGKELVAVKKIEKSGEAWQVDSSERNWANAAELKSGTSSSKPIAPTAETKPTVLSNTRWTVTEQDYAALGQIDSKVRRSLLSTALNEVGIFEFGTDWEKLHIASYAKAVGPPWSNFDQHFAWQSAFVAWVVSQSHLSLPSEPASSYSWRSWGTEVPTKLLKPGMIGIVQLKGLGTPIPLLMGLILGKQVDCIELIFGNVANRVVIACVAEDFFLTVREPSGI